MGAGGGKGAPAPPDFTAAATPTQNTPWATSSWTQGPSAPGHWEDGFGNSYDGAQGAPGSHYVEGAKGPMTQHVGLNPALDQANQSMMGQLGSSWGTPLDNGQQARQHAEDALYGQATSRLDPMWGQQQHDLQTQLANQGIDPSSRAYQTQMDNFGRSRNDAYQGAINNASMLGGQEAQRQQGMDLASRAAPLAGMAGLQGLSGMPQNPLLSAAMAQYQGALQNYGIEQQGKNSTMGGLLGLGGTLGAAKILGPAAVASDAREKTAITDTGGFVHGVREVHFAYKDRPHQKYRGVLAQDVERVFPDEVFTDEEGRKRVSGRFRPEPIEAGLKPYLDEMPQTKAQVRLLEIEREAATETGVDDDG